MFHPPFVDERTEGDSATPTFDEALSRLGSFVNASKVNQQGTSISDFKARYSVVLDRIRKEGSLEVLTRNKERYVILDASQLLALTENVHPEPFAADLLSDLNLLPFSEERPRSRLPAGESMRFGRLPR